jgi:hypothetical protein
LGVGRWALGVGRWTLGVGRWALGVGRWTLNVERSALDVAVFRLPPFTSHLSQFTNPPAPCLPRQAPPRKGYAPEGSQAKAGHRSLITPLSSSHWTLDIGRWALGGRSQDIVYASGSGHGIHLVYILFVVFIRFHRLLRADIRPQKACAGGVDLTEQ